MKSSIVYLAVFTMCAAFGNVVDSWISWFYGVVFGLSIYEVGGHIKRRCKR